MPAPARVSLQDHRPVPLLRIVPAPAQVVLIRHAEKPDKGPELSRRGRRRADALVDFVLEHDELARFGPPAAVFAQKPTAGRPSRRAVDTVAPLAAALDLDIRKFAHHEEKEMVREIRTGREFAGRMVLVCWRHETIGDIARRLGAPDPGDWDNRVFDRAWVLTYPRWGPPRLLDLPQRLLDGDSRR